MVSRVDPPDCSTLLQDGSVSLVNQTPSIRHAMLQLQWPADRWALDYETIVG